jgi:hypothetical protein
VKRTSIVTGLILLVAMGATAGDLGQWLASPDWHRWLDDGGLSPDRTAPRWYRVQEIGGTQDDEFASRPLDEDGEGAGDTGRRLKAGGLSLLVPGLGQFYNGQKSKGLVMLGVEVVIWGAYIGFDNHADNLQGDAQNWAGIYAGTSGSHSDSYWQSVGRYMDSDAWYESQLREARAFGEPAPPPPPGSEEWQWRSESYRDSYQGLRADANSAYDRRDLMILFAILNRAVSIFDAVRNGGEREPDDAPMMGTRIGGVDLALEVSPSFKRPEARAVASWEF